MHVGAEVIATRHQAGAGGGADGTGVETGELDAVTTQFVEIGSLEELIAVRPDIAITLVVGDDQYHVGTARG